MKVLFEPKRLIEIDSVNASIVTRSRYIDVCEQQYNKKISAVADQILDSACPIVMLSGPSASGKTTSSYKLARQLERCGRKTAVISMDNFFRNIEEYPTTSDGKPDFEHLQAVDVERINVCLKELIEDGKSDMPTYDFLTQHRCGDTLHIEVANGEIVIIEGIHALNPVVSQSVSGSDVFKIYAGLRAEYSEGGKRVVTTRDLRITRRLVRDYYFRGHSLRNTLELWNRLMDGEEKWIKPFKPDADILLDTSFEYEPGLFAPILTELCNNPAQGGDFRDVLLRVAACFKRFQPIETVNIPKDSMLREFVGGLEL